MFDPVGRLLSLNLAGAVTLSREGHQGRMAAEVALERAEVVVLVVLGQGYDDSQAVVIKAPVTIVPGVEFPPRYRVHCCAG